MVVVAAKAWPSNAELIEDVASLYLDKKALTLDPTYGNGVWWKKWRPNNLVCHDQKIDGTDFRKLNYPDGKFIQIAYDPPYVAKGSREKSGIRHHDDLYGLHEAPRNPQGVQDLVNDGLTEMYRLVAPEGIVLCKCKDYISSNKLWMGTFLTVQHALSLGFTVEDHLVMVTPKGPQPPGRRQVHARRNLSDLFVFRKPK